MTDTIIPVQTEYEELLETVRKLRARVIELTAERDDLLYHICPALQAKYDEKIGSVEREILAAQMYLKEKQRIIEILQAQLNRQEKPSMKEAEKKAHEEFRAYEEDLKKKAEEARRFREHWENETQWSRHEQESRDRKKENRTGQSAETEQPAGTEAETHKRIGIRERQDEDPINEINEDEDPIHELKSLYRQIVKRLHPDVHPNPTEREKDLLDRANKAYKAGDLEEMRRIWEELAGTEQSEESFEDTEEGRAQLRELIEKLCKRCAELEKEIRQIKTSFPYTIKALLDDDKTLEMKHRELVDRLAEVRAMLDKIDEYIAELKRRMKEKKQDK